MGSPRSAQVATRVKRAKPAYTWVPDEGRGQAGRRGPGGGEFGLARVALSVWKADPVPDDWEWFWAGESGRDRLLRDEIEGLQGAASVARSQSARLSSQLAHVQGSMERRLSALAAAFDAYVELGDVREQLAAFPDTSATRREATAALRVLTRDGTPERLEEDQSGYWLAPAMNAVIALAAGSADPDAEQRAIERDRDAELFMVAAAGALGVGEQVGGRIPALLVSDGPLSAAQLALWSAVLGGQFGAILAGVRASWQPAITTSGSDWRGWAAAEADTESPVEVLRWIESQLSAADPGSTSESEPDDSARGTSARVGLQAVVTGLLERGMGEEVELLERARTLRAAIEEPGQAAKPADAAPEEQPLRTVTDEVRQAFLAADPGTATRAELLGWVRPGLQAAVAELAAEAERTSPENVKARTAAGVIEVGPTGASEADVQGAEQRLLDRYPPSRRKLRLSVAGAGVLVIIALVDLVTGPTALVVLALIGAVICGIVALIAVRDEGRKRRELATDQTETRTRLTEAAQRAKELEGVRLDTAAEARRLVADLQGRLATDPA